MQFSILTKPLGPLTAKVVVGLSYYCCAMWQHNSTTEAMTKIDLNYNTNAHIQWCWSYVPIGSDWCWKNEARFASPFTFKTWRMPEILERKKTFSIVHLQTFSENQLAVCVTALEQPNNAFTSLYSTLNSPDSQGDGTKIMPFIISLYLPSLFAI